MPGEEIAVATHDHVVEATKPSPALGLFERYLTLVTSGVNFTENQRFEIARLCGV